MAFVKFLILQLNVLTAIAPNPTTPFTKRTHITVEIYSSTNLSPKVQQGKIENVLLPYLVQ